MHLGRGRRCDGRRACALDEAGAVMGGEGGSAGRPRESWRAGGRWASVTVAGRSSEGLDRARKASCRKTGN